MLSKVDSSSPRPSQSSVRGTQLAAFRAATLELWGEDGLRDVAARMSQDVRAGCIDGPADEAWLPETFVVEWCEAAWAGPCGEDEASFRRLIDRMTMHGFARERHVLLSIANPPMLVRRLAELWSAKHSHGTLAYVPLDPRTARLTLKDHVYTSTPLLGLASAEAFRFAVSLCDAGDVTEEHAIGTGGALHVILRW